MDSHSKLQLVNSTGKRIHQNARFIIGFIYHGNHVSASKQQRLAMS
jgi:hypothetical protein